MALNPALDPTTGEPLRVPNECFILRRVDVEFEVLIDQVGKLKGTGFCILTTLRIVLVNIKNTQLFGAFDLPLCFMYKENFVQ